MDNITHTWRLSPVVYAFRLRTLWRILRISDACRLLFTLLVCVLYGEYYTYLTLVACCVHFSSTYTTENITQTWRLSPVVCAFCLRNPRRILRIPDACRLLFIANWVRRQSHPCYDSCLRAYARQSAAWNCFNCILMYYYIFHHMYNISMTKFNYC